MAKTGAERSRAWRERQRTDSPVAAVPYAAGEQDGPEPDSVAAALELSLSKLPDADPVLVASARRLAFALDWSANPATAAELRRTMNELRPKTAGRGSNAGPAPRKSKVSALRADYQASRIRRAAG